MLIESLYGKGKKVIDIGCGTGMFTRSIAGHFKDIRSIDINAARVDTLKKYCIDNGILNVFSSVMSAYDLAFRAGEFDLAVCYRSVDHIPDYKKALDEAWRVLKPGGDIYLNLADAQASSVSIANLEALRAFEDELFACLGIAEGNCEVRLVDAGELGAYLAAIGFEPLAENRYEMEKRDVEEYCGRVVGKTEELLETIRVKLPGDYERNAERYHVLKERAAEHGHALRPLVELVFRKK